MKTQGEAAIPFVFVSYSETKARVQTGTDWMQQHVGSKGERTTVPMKNLSLTPNMTGNKCHTLKQFETMPYFVDTQHHLAPKCSKKTSFHLSIQNVMQAMTDCPDKTNTSHFTANSISGQQTSQKQPLSLQRRASPLKQHLYTLKRVKKESR